MGKLRKIIFLLMIATLIAGFVFIGCGKSGGGSDGAYTINVKSMGGLGLSDVTVTAYSSAGEIANGVTDNTGKFTFSASKGEYDISISNLPLGYSPATNNVYRTRSDNFTLNLFAVSSVIDEEVPESKVYRQGDVIYDFSITDSTDSANPQTYKLSEVLAQKKMVLLNFWNSHCVPCMSEMPELERAYSEYGEDVEIFGINVPLLGEDRQKDVNDVRKTEHAGSDGNKYLLTFPLAIDKNNMPYHFGITAIPVSVVIDRYGVVADIHQGSMDKSGFTKMFDKYISDDYVQEQQGGSEGDDNPPEELVREKPNVAMPASADIAAAINGGGYDFAYTPEEDTDDAEFSWPWLIGDKDGEKYIYPANHEVNYSFATIKTKVTIDSVGENDNVVLAFDLQWSTENNCDYFYVIINNKLVYEYTGTTVGKYVVDENGVEKYVEEPTWGTWSHCYALVATEPGDYTLSLMYVKDQQDSYGQDSVWIKDMRLEKTDDIDVPSLDMPRDAALDWDGTNYLRYINAVPDDEGFYHKDSADGPYILADLMNQTAFNARLESDWGISAFAVNGDFDYNAVEDDDPTYNPYLNKTDAITKWAQAANNSELPGLTIVNKELKDLLEEFIVSRIGSKTQQTWLEFCTYFDHYGTDDEDKGICSAERNPIRGLLRETAMPSPQVHEGQFDNLSAIPEENTVIVDFDRLIVPRGLRYSFTPTESGVYRFRTQSAQDRDTMAWLLGPDDSVLVSSDEQLENSDAEYNIVLTYYLEAGNEYLFSTCFADVGVYIGKYTFTIEHLGKEFRAWQYASRNYFTTENDDLGAIVNYKNVEPVLYNGRYYNAKKDAQGRYISDGNGGYQPNLNDPIYVDFVTGARFFDDGSLELCFEYSDPANVRKTVSASVLSKVWGKQVPSDEGWPLETTLETVKGGALNEDDWTNIQNYLMAVYGDSAYIESQDIIDLMCESETVGDLVDFLKDYCLDLFDQSHIYYDPGYGIDQSRCIDYTDLVKTYYDLAMANEEIPGCVQLTSDLQNALDMFCKRVGGFPELSTDWLRLCAHYEYIGASV